MKACFTVEAQRARSFSYSPFAICYSLFAIRYSLSERD